MIRRTEDVNENDWRISSSGLTINSGWGEGKKIVAEYPGTVVPLDDKQFLEWLDSATRICDIHNAAIRILSLEYMEAQFTLGLITSGARHDAATRLCSLAEIATRPADMLLQDLKSGALAFADDEKSKS